MGGSLGSSPDILPRRPAPPAVLSAAVPLIGPAAAGLGALPAGLAAAPVAGLLGLLAAAGFAALLGAVAARREVAAEDWTRGLRRPVAALCAAAFGLKAMLCGGLAWQVWELQGPANALGLSAVALAFLSAALAFGGRALRRR